MDVAFTLVLAGVDVSDAAVVERLAEHCPAGILAERDGVVTMVVVRDAPDTVSAIEATVSEIESGGRDVRVIGIDFDLVSASDVAERTGRSRQSVLQLVTGRRGQGGFPPPLGWVGDGIRVWDWGSVSEWFRTTGAGGDPEVSPTRSELVELNAWLDARARGVARPLIDLPADLNMEDDYGRNIARVTDALNPEAVAVGAMLVAGASGAWSWAVVDEIDGGFAYFHQIGAREAARRGNLVAPRSA